MQHENEKRLRIRAAEECSKDTGRWVALDIIGSHPKIP